MKQDEKGKNWIKQMESGSNRRNKRKQDEKFETEWNRMKKDGIG